MEGREIFERGVDGVGCDRNESLVDSGLLCCCWSRIYFPTRTGKQWIRREVTFIIVIPPTVYPLVNPRHHRKMLSPSEEINILAYWATRRDEGTDFLPLRWTEFLCSGYSHDSTIAVHIQDNFCDIISGSKALQRFQYKSPYALAPPILTNVRCYIIFEMLNNSLKTARLPYRSCLMRLTDGKARMFDPPSRLPPCFPEVAAHLETASPPGPLY